MEKVDSRTVYEGKLSAVRIETFRHPDGEESVREVVVHPGAVGIVAYDDEVVYLVRQPREAVGITDLLEIPAGKLDVEGESRLECAQRELDEEVGLRASEWAEVKRVFTTPGFATEEFTLFHATGLEEDLEHVGLDGERIEIVRWPLSDLEGAIDASDDATSVIGLMWLRAHLSK